MSIICMVLSKNIHIWYSLSIYLLCCIFLLTWCSRPWSSSETDEITEISDNKNQDDASVWSWIKKDYYIETEQVSALWSSPFLLKTWKLIWASDVTVSAQIAWRVATIHYDEWWYPTKWAKVITLTDSNKSTLYATQRWRESVEAAELNYASTKVNLDNAYVDLELAVKRAKQQLDVALKDAWIQRLDAQKQLEDLEQQRADSEQQLKDAEQQLADSLESLKDTEQQMKDAEQQRLQAEQTAKTNNPLASGWSAELQLQKFDSDIQKLKFDLETKRDSDDQILEWFIASSKTIKDTIEVLNWDVVDALDRIVWVSVTNERLNDTYEQYLWAKDKMTLRVVEDTMRRMINAQRSLQNITLSIAEIDQLPSTLTWFRVVLDQLDTLLDQMDLMLQQSVTWTWFPQTQLDGLIAQVNWYQSQTLAQSSSITQQINQIESFVRTYKQNQESLEKQIDILVEQRGITEQQLKDVAKNSDIWLERADIWEERTEIATQRTKIAKLRTEIAAQRTAIAARRTAIWLERSELWLQKADIASQNAVDQAQLNLESAQNALRANEKTRDISLASLQNSIEQAKIWYNESLSNQSKFSIFAPISWTIWEILVDSWEEVNAWTPLFTLTSTQDQEVVISLSSAEKDIVTVWSQVVVKIWWKEFEWTVDSISDIADENLLYKTTIYLNEVTDRVWEVATVEIPMNSPFLLVPINYVEMLTSKQWSLWIRNGQEGEKAQVELWKVRWSDIEIHSPLGDDVEIITSPMSNYDRNIHDAKRKPGTQLIQWIDKKENHSQPSILDLWEESWDED